LAHRKEHLFFSGSSVDFVALTVLNIAVVKVVNKENAVIHVYRKQPIAILVCFPMLIHP
jgi:hypothetical protein